MPRRRPAAPSPQPRSAALDDDGFPFVAPRAAETDRERVPVTCPACLTPPGGAAYVIITRQGRASLFCNHCNVRIFTGSQTAHDLLRRWVKLLRDDTVRDALARGLAQVDG